MRALPATPPRHSFYAEPCQQPIDGDDRPSRVGLVAVGEAQLPHVPQPRLFAR